MRGGNSKRSVTSKKERDTARKKKEVKGDCRSELRQREP